jgi:hypothetical protein
MPKVKKESKKDNRKNEDGTEEKTDETKEIILDDEEKVLDPELIAGDLLPEDEDEESEDATLDEEVDPFKDRWEE